MKQTVGLFLAVLLAACTAGPAPVAQAKSDRARQAADPAKANAAATAINAFGLDLYRALANESPDDNAVISPASIELALAMARLGAGAETATQMDSVLRFPTDLGAAFNALDQALAARSGTFKAADGTDETVSLRIANAPFAQQDTAWQQPFLDALAQDFGAGVRLVDYKRAHEAARRLINDWVDQQTEERIKELLGQGVLDDSTRLVLVNAIYLKAAWLKPFTDDLTASADFSRADGSTVQVSMMHQQSSFAYAAGDSWQAVELPYIGGQLAMDLILPDDLTAWRTSFDATTFEQLTAALAPAEVKLALPRFEAATKADLADVLSSLGMPDAFDPNRANFAGMTTEEQLYVGHVIHQANITVDEKGTEAAAATAVVMDATAAPAEVVTLTFDRPFVFALRDTVTGATLFLGQITDPSADQAQ
jgi:serpin B